MSLYLAKTDPDTYSLDELEREGRTTWDGVSNPQALRAIQAMRPGDTVLIYHSGGQAAIVGVAKVVSEPRPDPRHPKLTVVDLAFAKRLDSPVTLHEIKSSGLFADWSLVRQGRLSTMSVPDAFIEWLRRRAPEALTTEADYTSA
jgi:predicted RNA-binding protein with PUA-like domain